MGNKTIIFILLAIIISIVFTKSIEHLDLNSKGTAIINIKSHVKNISIPRQIESDGLNKVKSYVMNQIEAMGFNAIEQKFTYNVNSKDYKLSNIIGINKKASGPYILLGAHIDSHQFSNTEASIDSATSVGIILELANNLIKRNPFIPLMIVFFDGEEAIDGKWTENTSLIGSNYFVNNFNLNLITKAYIFDLIGGDIQKNKIAGFADMQYTFTDLSILSKINKKLYGVDEQIFMDPANFIAGNAPEDDHVPFVRKNTWVCNLIPYKFPDQYHKASDTYLNINWKYIEIFFHVLFEFFSLG
jgi:glutaminyl-peptide cyclotransferase